MVYKHHISAERKGAVAGQYLGAVAWLSLWGLAPTSPQPISLAGPKQTPTHLPCARQVQQGITPDSLLINSSLLSLKWVEEFSYVWMVRLTWVDLLVNAYSHLQQHAYVSHSTHAPVPAPFLFAWQACLSGCVCASVLR